jgi:hypothetical protein
MTAAKHPHSGDQTNDVVVGQRRWHTVVLVAGLITIGVGGLVAFSGADSMIGWLPLGLIVVWLVVLAVALQLHHRRVLVALGVVSLVVLALGIVGYPAVTRAAMSESELAAAAQQVREGATVDRAGLYWPTESWYSEADDCVVFRTQLFFIDDHGVAYCASSAGPDRRLFEHLYGNVYEYHLEG